MLANPQHLDISELLRSPTASPFATALRRAELVLVVPNHRATRIEAVFHAFPARHGRFLAEIDLKEAPKARGAAQESVYTRLWCAYEAFLAQEEGKDILIAKGSSVGRQLGGCMLMALAATVGAVAGAHCKALGLTPYTQGVPMVTVLLFALSLLLEDDEARQLLNVLCETLSWPLGGSY